MFQIVIFGQAGCSYRDPESTKFQYIWIPASAGMTTNTGYNERLKDEAKPDNSLREKH